MYEKLYFRQKGKRSDKDSIRFVNAFEAAANRNPKVSLANIVFRTMSGNGCFTFKKDIEFASELNSFNNEKPASLPDILSTFGSSETKDRTVQQSAAFCKILEQVLRDNPNITIGEILAEVVMGGGYCSYHEDEDLIKRMEAFRS
ncbi:MAG: hypothetical protein M1155_00915 [Patescibacteria group bacterium]|nr:hypothetical protein [Patescibacteria group bacterium]